MVFQFQESPYTRHEQWLAHDMCSGLNSTLFSETADAACLLLGEAEAQCFFTKLRPNKYILLCRALVAWREYFRVAVWGIGVRVLKGHRWVSRQPSSAMFGKVRW